MIKASEMHRDSIVAYCEEEPSINLFILADIALYGFNSDIQEIWIDEKDGIQSVALRYHDTLILYTKDKLNIEAVLGIIDQKNIGSVSGKASVIAQIYPHVEEKFNKREMNFAQIESAEKLVNIESLIQVATVEDARDIAVAYGAIEEFKHLYADTVEGRQAQIENRIKSGEGQHVFIKEAGKIVAHGNTAAEGRLSAMIGGLMTMPDYRGRGYAKMITSYLCQDLFKQGKKACLFYTEKTQKLFKELGFTDIEKWTVLGGKK